MLRPPHRLSTLPFLKAQVFSLRVLRRMLYSISANTWTLAVLASSMKIHWSCSYFVYLALMSERFSFFTLAVWPSFLAKGMSPKEWSVKPPITLHIPFCEAKTQIRRHASSRRPPRKTGESTEESVICLPLGHRAKDLRWVRTEVACPEARRLFLPSSGR